MTFCHTSQRNKTELIAGCVRGSNKPAPVKRVEILKPNGGVKKTWNTNGGGPNGSTADLKALRLSLKRFSLIIVLASALTVGLHDAIAKVVDLYGARSSKSCRLRPESLFRSNVNH